jgi:hypothetical protein
MAAKNAADFFKLSRRVLVSAAVLLPVASTLSTMAKAASQPVTMCLAILTDVSTSVTGDSTESFSKENPTANEYHLQQFGTANALTSADVKRVIESNNGIGLVYFEFAFYPYIRVPFQVIRTASDIEAFASKIKVLKRSGAGATGIGNAVDAAIKELVQRCPESRLVIDVSGDGKNNIGITSEAARNRAEDLGITINGLPIINPTADGEPDIVATYKNRVVTSDGFVINATDGFQGFQRAMTLKLVNEIAGIKPDTDRAPHRYADGSLVDGILRDRRISLIPGIAP